MRRAGPTPAGGSYRVTVLSDGGLADTQDLTVALTNRNEAPTANAGADQADIEQGARVSLSGSGADPDAGDTLSFAQPTVCTPDGRPLSAAASVTVAGLAPAESPEITGVSSFTVVEGADRGGDADGDG